MKRLIFIIVLGGSLAAQDAGPRPLTDSQRAQVWRYAFEQRVAQQRLREADINLNRLAAEFCGAGSTIAIDDTNGGEPHCKEKQ